MTDKTRVIAARVPNEVAEWIEAQGTAREVFCRLYQGYKLNWNGFFSACDKRRIDYQKAIDRMTDLINEK